MRQSLQLSVEASRPHAARRAVEALRRAPAAAESEERPRGQACACGGTCPRCRAAAVEPLDLASSAPLGTDDIAETDFGVPRAEADAAAPVPRDAQAAGGTAPAGCCDQAFSNGLARSDYGGVICCNNVKHSCVWPSNMSSALTSARARSISIAAARVHEDTHHDDIDCSGAAVERPAYKAGKNVGTEECTGYRAEVAYFDAHVGDCGGDAQCTTQVRARRAVKQSQADGHCT